MPKVATVEGAVVECTEEALIRALLSLSSTEIPATGNSTPEMLIDEIGPYNALEKWADTRQKLYRGVFDAKITDKDDVIKGDRWYADIARFPQARFSQDKAKKFLT